MKKKILLSIVSIILIFATLLLTSCTDIFNKESEPKVQYVTTQTGEKIQVKALAQEAYPNEDFMDTMVSWYDDEYDYFVFDIGKIKNVPLTSAYSVFMYTGAEMTYEETIEKTSQKTLTTSTSTARTSMVKTTFSGTSNVNVGIATKLSETVSLNVEKGYSNTITNEKTNETVWTDTYTQCESFSETSTTKMTFTFNKDCSVGNYQYLYLGNITVYYAVVRSRETGEIYVQTYDKIDSYKYVLNYTGEDDEFPINDKTKITVNTDFIDDLPTPTVYIEGQKPEVTLENVTQSWYWEDSFKVNLLDFKSPVRGKLWTGFSEYYALGYNKVKVSYNYYASTTTNLFGDGANIMGYLTNNDDNLSSALYHYEKEPKKNGGWIEGEIVLDLRHFAQTNKICLVFDTKNYTETYTISKITLTVELYKG